MMKLQKLVWLLFFFCTLGCSASYSETTPVAETPKHHTAEGFQNVYNKTEKKSFFSFVHMRMFGEDEWADYEASKDTVPVQKADLSRIKAPGDLPQITWVGHSTFLIQYQGVNFLTDPIFSEYASPFSFAGPRRVHPPSISIRDLPRIDFVIISHNHYDHLDLGTVEQIHNQTRWMVPLGLKTWFLDAGVLEENIEEFDWWDSVEINSIKITATPSQHWSGRGLWDRFKTLWASWTVQIEDLDIWFGGDTGYNSYQFKEIGERFPDFDIALIPIGAYAPRWFMKAQHVNPEEAVKIHQDLQACQSYGIHWGTFPLTAEPIDDPPKRLKQALAEANIPETQFLTMAIGETQSLSPKWNQANTACPQHVATTTP